MSNPEVNDTFLDQARPKLKILEDIRLDKLQILKWRQKIAKPVAAVMMPVLGFCDYWLLKFQSGSEDSAAGLTIAVLAALWGWVTQPKRDYTNAYKKKMLPEIAGLFGNFKYDVNGKIDMSSMKPSKIIPGHSKYSSEDFFSGDYQGVGIRFSEIHLQKKSGDDYKTVFRGLTILLTHGARKFYGHTILTKDRSKMGEWFERQSTGLKRANMVDPEFENLFDVYTNDQVEARYLIDPLIIEALKALYSEYYGDQMMAAFYDDHVLIMIESKNNHFEPANIDVPATNENELLSMKREIAQILSIVDRLSLYDPKARRAATEI